MIVTTLVTTLVSPRSKWRRVGRGCGTNHVLLVQLESQFDQSVGRIEDVVVLGEVLASGTQIVEICGLWREGLPVQRQIVDLGLVQGKQ